MVSRRNLVTIILMMITIFFMFQFTQVVKFRNSQFDTNEYAKDPVQFADGEYKAKMTDGYVVYVGSNTTVQYKAVEEWCENTKKYLVYQPSLSNVMDGTCRDAEMIFVDGLVSGAEDPDKLEAITEFKVPIVLVRIPEYKAVKSSRKMRKILGIRKVREEETEALGYQFFDGFLIGGEAAYMPQKPEEEKYNDFDLKMPWYDLGAGTIAYAVGMLDEKEYKAEEFPRFIWRNVYNETYIFVVSNDILNEDFGAGIISSIAYEANDYYLYPVVNSQNVVLSEFPYVTDENSTEIKRIYSMNSKSLSRDIMWPALLSLATNDKLKFTCYLNPSNSNLQSEKESKEYLEFYLKQLQEIDGEIGQCVDLNDGNNSFYNAVPNYKYVTGFSEDVNETAGEYTSLVTMNAPREVSYLSDNTTCMNITNYADEYTYSRALKNRCTINSLGYATTLIDTKKVLMPANKNEEWQNFSKEVFGNVDTIYCSIDYFDFTAVSESDAKVRNYLNLKYASNREDNKIDINVDNVSEAYFVFRTHNEDIKSITNGTCKKLEKDTYLIKGFNGKVTVELEESGDILYYQKPL